MNDRDNRNPADQPRPQTENIPLSGYGRIGKVARLPKVIRDRVNEMMLDGRTYLQIIAALGDDGKDLTEDNLSTWKGSGYLEFRAEQKERDAMRFQNEYAVDLARETQGISLCEATSKLLLAQILDALRQAGPGSVQSALTEHPEIYVRLAHAVARISASAIACERARIMEVERVAKLERREPDPATLAITDNTVSTVNEMLRTH